MSLNSFFNSKVKKMDWLDIGLLKWSCIAFGVLLTMLIPGLLKIHIGWIIALFIILAARPIYRVYIKKD